MAPATITRPAAIPPRAWIVAAVLFRHGGGTPGGARISLRQIAAESGLQGETSVSRLLRGMTSAGAVKVERLQKTGTSDPLNVYRLSGSVAEIAQHVPVGPVGESILTATERLVLAVVRMHAPDAPEAEVLTKAEIAELLNLNQRTVRRAVEVLSSDGFIQAERRSGDQRFVIYRATEKGRSV